MKKKILVLTDHMPWGHRSIARAIYNYFLANCDPKKYEISYLEEKMPLSVLNEIYTFAYRFLPATNRISNQIMDSRRMRQMFSELSQISLPNLEKQVNRYRPDLIISSYFYFSHTLAKWKVDNNLQFKLWSMVADPWSINPVSYMAGVDKHFVYDRVGIKMGKKYGITEDKLVETGWWVRPEMYEEKYKTDKAVTDYKKKLGFFDDRPIVFVGGGSLGTNSLSKLLPILLLVKTKVGVIFNTGTDKLAYNLVEEYNRLFKRLRKNDLVLIKNLGWIENMAQVLSVCDIVFGKAGPNFLFDVVANGKPIVAITHIGGQEDGNIEIIKQKKLGWVREKGNHAGEFLLKYLKNPQKYNRQFAKTIKLEAEHNQNSLKKMWKLAGTEI